MCLFSSHHFICLSSFGGISYQLHRMSCKDEDLCGTAKSGENVCSANILKNTFPTESTNSEMKMIYSFSHVFLK